MQENYRPALELAQRELRSIDPGTVAERSGAELVLGNRGQEFRITLLNRDYGIPLGDLLVYDTAKGALAGISTTLVILHYLANASGSAVAHEWIPFRNLPGGNIYDSAFRRQCIEALIAAFGSDPEALCRAAETLGGIRATLGDISYVFQVLPQLPMACVLWQGDEEQGAEVSLLYDAVARRYLPTEDLAALGRMLAFGLIQLQRR